MNIKKGIDSAIKINENTGKRLKKNGITYIARYIGSPDSWKTVQPEEVKAILNEDLSIISIWETNPTSSSYFSYDKGKSDAEKASKYASSVGQPNGAVIYFTVDFAAEKENMPSIVDYFSGVREGIDRHYATGAYGSYNVIRMLQSHKAVDYFWQTYAWSEGNVCKNLHMYQYQNDVNFCGITVDHNKVFQEPGAWNPINSPYSKGADPVIIDTYKVKAGDTLSEIAKEYKITVEDLIKWNKINDPDFIQVGQVLHLKAVPQQTYTVKKGDTLSEIAKQYLTTIDKIVQVNELKDKNLIFPGQKLNIP